MSKAEITKEYMNLNSLSAYSDLGKGTLRDYIRSGSLPAYKIKGLILVKKTEFDRWISGFLYQKEAIESIADEALKSLKSER